MSDTEKEESDVRHLATGLCTVWNQNPSAFRGGSLVAFSFQFFIRLATVFAEEVGDLSMLVCYSLI